MPPSLPECPVHTHNEWDPLEEVIVGSVQGAVYPEYGPILAANGDPGWLWHFQGEFVEEELVENATEQLDFFAKTLEEAGVKVHRPDPIPHNLAFSSPFWQSRGGFNSANPRDLFLILGDTILESASPLRYRKYEAMAHRRLMTDYFRRGARWITAPPSSMREPLYDHSFMAQSWENKPWELPPGETQRYPITEYEIAWEAADFVRCGRDLFVTQSIVTNQLGIEWVRRHAGPDYRVHEIQTRCRAPWHIDTTFVPLAPGVALVNPKWVKELPECLSKWTILEAPEPTYDAASPMADPQFTSQWLSMNVFSLDPEHVFVDAQQTNLMRLLEKHGFTPIPLSLDHVGTFGGSFHCVTLDIRRRGELEDYTSGV